MLPTLRALSACAWRADVSKRVDLERKLAELTTAQMTMLEQMFPRHVIEHMLAEPGLLGTDVGQLASDHELVSVLFADVVRALVCWAHRYLARLSSALLLPSHRMRAVRCARFACAPRAPGGVHDHEQAHFGLGRDDVPQVSLAAVNGARC